ncbi:MAG: DUF2283 domain-containing protein [Anaerolineae bacterium]|nr:DUF2283 domain-containing protein [Anaerolineae bacterium]NUQ05377.1 DUF2283 domain-containing protein [Anaerolineae bacterium]
MVTLDPYLRLLPEISRVPGQSMWMTYDAEADVMYINFKRPSLADDSELTDDDVIIRYQGDEVIGYTILHISDRRAS